MDVLPHDLEYEIFQLAYQTERENPVHLLLVAKRVYEWLMPKLYQIVVFRGRRTHPRSVSASTLRRYGHHTRHLILSSPTLPVTEVLSYCPNLENLALWIGSWSHNIGLESENPLTTLKPKRLSIQLGELQHISMEPGRGTGNKNQETKVQIKANIVRFLSNITHLDICARVHQHHQISALRYCTALTHLCLFDSLPARNLRWIFDTCARLEILIWMISTPGAEEDYLLRAWLEDAGDLNRDELSRIAFIRCQNYGEDWERGAKGEEDMWALAEREVKEWREVPDLVSFEES
ncbi:hypothetical protein BDN72DRAFT_961218 [Pluteus cervinus]|uniref:Uncharacterized protein n=1 Tax=Pluteus cervinus TaxID=181527 RepID=A0ACD3AN20_9AGAR|nr:hypothetical protein BDN72DRAFT_961218 [Pluteus cervinus]